MKPLTFEVPDEYPYLVLACIILCLECMLMAIPGSKQRQQCYTEQYMKKFTDEHQAIYGPLSTPSKGGYPDAGNGFYSSKLSYKQWYELNNAFRVH